jgi:aminoacylase
MHACCLYLQCIKNLSSVESALSFAFVLHWKSDFCCFLVEIITMASFADKLSKGEGEDAIDVFTKLLQYKTISGSAPEDGSYNACAAYLLQFLNDLGLENVQIVTESLPNKPIVVGTWIGTSDLPAILLNSHYDVVPVMEEYWTVPAFSGVRKESKIYGRGAQDMKCVCAQYLIALKKLKESGFQPLRTIHISYVPDEEIGGSGGMGVLLSSDWYSEVQIDLALDEGLASEDDNYAVFYGERLPWWVRITAEGSTGHGSRFIEGTAVEQIMGVTQKALAFRSQQKDILHGVNHAGCSHGVAMKKVLGDVTSLNVTMLRAGVQAGGLDVMNVVPARAEAGFDIRISPHMDPNEMKSKLDLWCEEVTQNTTGLPKGGGVKWEYIVEKNPLKAHYTTSHDSKENPWWR